VPDGRRPIQCVQEAAGVVVQRQRKIAQAALCQWGANNQASVVWQRHDVRGDLCRCVVERSGGRAGFACGFAMGTDKRRKGVIKLDGGDHHRTDRNPET
jgi:hypothetical protein